MECVRYLRLDHLRIRTTLEFVLQTNSVGTFSGKSPLLLASLSATQPYLRVPKHSKVLRYFRCKLGLGVIQCADLMLLSAHNSPDDCRKLAASRIDFGFGIILTSPRSGPQNPAVHLSRLMTLSLKQNQRFGVTHLDMIEVAPRSRL